MAKVSSIPPRESAHAGLSEAAIAVKNGIRLASSLLATWVVALVVRLQLPRELGPELFGRYSFSDAFVGAVFSFLSLGIGFYIMKEVAVRPKHASDFFGGVLLLRGILSLLAFFGISLFLSSSDYPVELQQLVLVFSFVHFVVGVNAYLGNVLQACSKVGALATMNVVAKLVWGAGLLGALLLDAPIWVLPIPSLASEVLKLYFLMRAARAEVGLELRVDAAETKAVVLSSLPFFANSIALELGFRIDVSILEFMAPGNEVGWYSAANSLAGLTLLLSPALGWVVMPLLARAHARSVDEVYRILRVSLRGVLMCSIPTALMIALAADLCVEVAFGAAFAPAAHAVRLLAPMFVATYVAMLLGTTLVIMQRSWTLTLVSFISLGVEALLIAGLVPLLRDQGAGFVAAAAAIGLAMSELVTMLLLLHAVGARALDRETIHALLKCILLCGVVTLVDRALLSLGPARLALDVVLYTLGVFALRAVRLAEVKDMIGLIRARRSGAS